MLPTWTGAARAAALAALLSLALPSVARPHAVPLERVPDPAAPLATAPTEIAIRFSERVDPRASRLRVLGASGARADSGDSQVVPGDPYRLRVSLAPGTPEGVYTVAWRVLSADDGHVTEGTYVLAVGAGAAPDPRAATPTTVDIRLADAIGRALALAGELALVAVVAGPGVVRRRWGGTVDDPRPAALALLAVLGGAALAFLDRARTLAPEAGLPQAMALVAETGVGRVWAARVSLTSCAAAAVLGSSLLAGRPRLAGILRGLALALVASSLAVAGLASHSAAAVWRALALSTHAVHLVAGVLWVGALLWFASRFWTGARPQRPLSHAVPAFSLVAVVAAGLVVASGAYLGRLEVGAWRDLVDTTYGRLLLAKLLLVAGMVALAGYHHRVAYRRVLAASNGSPPPSAPPGVNPGSAPHGPAARSTRWRLASAAAFAAAGGGPGADREAARFRAGVRLEAALGLGVLLLAALLATTSPPPARAAGEAYHETRTLDGVTLKVDLRPLRPGPATIRVTARDAEGRPLRDASAALVLLEPQDTAAGPVDLVLDRAGEGTFTRQGSFIGLTGAWTGKVVVQRNGAFDLNHRFAFTVQAAPPSPAPGRAPVGPLDPVVAAAVLVTASVCAAVYRRSRRDLRAAQATDPTTAAPAASRHAR